VTGFPDAAWGTWPTMSLKIRFSIQVTKSNQTPVRRNRNSSWFLAHVPELSLSLPMNIASHRSIRSRLAVSFAITPIIMIGLIAVGIVRVNDVGRSLSVINDVDIVKQRYAINFRGSVHDRAISLRDVVLVRHGKDFATVSARLSKWSRPMNSPPWRLTQSSHRGAM
jgi:hypothetical protein